MATALDSMWNTVKSWATKNAEQYVGEFIPPERTDLKDPPTAMVPMRDYFRLWLSDMFLARSRSWFVNEYPAVHSSVSLKFGPDIVKISHVTEAGTAVGRGANLDYALTDLLPFNGGTVEIQSGLIALKGMNYAAETIGILKDFSGLIGAPLGSALTIAEKVSGGVQKIAAGSEVALAFHRQFRSGSTGPQAGTDAANVLRPGYIAVVLATHKQIEPSRLTVKGSRLHYAEREGAAPKPLEGYDYMLFYVEGKAERDNWRMPNIEQPLNQAIEATLRGQTKEAEEFMTAAKVVIWQSPDLAVQDRRRVAEAIDAELAAIGGNVKRGAAPGDLRSLNDIMKTRAKSVDRALADPPLTLMEVLGQQT